MHPIDDPLMAEVIPSLAHLNAELLCCNDPANSGGRGGLKLLKQQLVRTDISPAAAIGPTRWHMDQPFLDEHFTAAPRQLYYHTMLALSPVVHNGAPFLVATGSFQRAVELTQEISSPAAKAEFNAACQVQQQSAIDRTLPRVARALRVEGGGGGSHVAESDDTRCTAPC